MNLGCALADNSPPLDWGKEEDRKMMDKRWDAVDVGSSEMLASATNEDAHASFVMALFRVKPA